MNQLRIDITSILNSNHKYGGGSSVRKYRTIVFKPEITFDDILTYLMKDHMLASGFVEKIDLIETGPKGDKLITAFCPINRVI